MTAVDESARRPGRSAANATDPITLELIRLQLASLADEVEADIVRTAYSPLIYDYRDYAVALLDPDGQLITHANGPLIFTMDLERPLDDCLRLLAEDGVALGLNDVVLHNYGGVTGQHLNNVNAYCPAYVEGDLVGWSAVRMHWADVGGKDPGSSSANDSTSIFQEGFNMRAARVFADGAWNRELVRTIEVNTRLPEQVRGDLISQVLAVQKGARQLAALASRYGPEILCRAIERIWDESETMTREVIESLPDGSYQAESWLDNDGVEDTKIKIRPVVTVSGADITIDLTDISDQRPGPFNSGNGADTAAKAALKFLLGGERRADAGAFRPLRLLQRPRSFLTCEFPAPMARWSIPIPSVVDTILRAMATPAPQLTAAGHHAAMGTYSFFGYAADRRFYKHMDTAPGGWGALRGADGPGPYKTLTHGDSADIPIEVVERQYPLRVSEYRLRDDLAGRGRWKGGPGTEKVLHVQEDVVFSCTFERTTCPPWGLAGGEAGRPGGVFVKRPAESEHAYAAKLTSIPLPAGTEVRVVSAGGGGWGSPDERNGADEDDGDDRA